MSDDLLAEVRKAAPSALWSSAVKMPRAGGVSQVPRDAEAVARRVRDPAHPTAPTVILYPGDGEWDCDCGGRASPCAHVAAAAIALAQGDLAAPAEGDAA